MPEGVQPLRVLFEARGGAVQEDVAKKLTRRESARAPGAASRRRAAPRESDFIEARAVLGKVVSDVQMGRKQQRTGPREGGCGSFENKK